LPKNIVICCDGTGNEFGDQNSNVVKLYSTPIIDGRQQVGYYHPGVGTMGAPTAHNKITKAWSVVMGLAFGAGLLASVGDAYRYLMNIYEPGDNVFLFGFSRGAYTARALAGAVHMFGLLSPGNEGLIPYVIRLYAKRTRNAAGMTHTFQVATEFKKTFCRDCQLHFVGVWDTVSSVGWVWDPLKLPYTGQNPTLPTAAMLCQSMNDAVTSETTCGENSCPIKPSSRSGLQGYIRMSEDRMPRLTADSPRSPWNGCFARLCSSGS
jgi:uncharacterized protein (DUF2235 family)